MAGTTPGCGVAVLEEDPPYPPHPKDSIVTNIKEIILMTLSSRAFLAGESSEGQDVRCHVIVIFL